jgi:hypothetical protein
MPPIPPDNPQQKAASATNTTPGTRFLSRINKTEIVCEGDSRATMQLTNQQFHPGA